MFALIIISCSIIIAVICACTFSICCKWSTVCYAAKDIGLLYACSGYRIVPADSYRRLCRNVDRRLLHFDEALGFPSVDVSPLRRPTSSRWRADSDLRRLQHDICLHRTELVPTTREVEPTVESGHSNAGDYIDHLAFSFILIFCTQDVIHNAY